jgi:hypothetical protein
VRVTREQAANREKMLEIDGTLFCERGFDEVIRTHTEGFYGALKARDFEALSRFYAADYMLVRPDGSVLSERRLF